MTAIAVQKKDAAGLTPLLAQRNQARLDMAKKLNGMLKTMSAITELGNQGTQSRFVSKFFSSAGEFQPADPNISMEGALKNHDEWQKTVLGSFGPKMERTNKLMIELIQALKEEDEVLKTQRALIEEGPRHLATIAYVKQKQAMEGTSFQKTEQQLLNFTCLQRHLQNVAMQMAHTPTPEQLTKITSQVESIQARQRDSDKQLLALQAQYEKLLRTEKIGSRALIALTNEMASVKKQQEVLMATERALHAKLEILAQTQYPEIMLQSTDLSDSMTGLKLTHKTRLNLYSGFTALSPTVLLSTSPGGGRCILMKFPVPPPEKVAYIERVCSFLHSSTHPNFITINELWEEDGFMYVDSPHYAGITMRDWMSKRLTTAPISVIRCLFEQILAAVHTLHQSGIAHGSPSLDNILIIEEEEEGDFFGGTFGPAVPILINFEFGLDAEDRKLELWEAPEIRSSASPLLSQDIWGLGNLICESLSSSQMSAELAPSSSVATIPLLSSKVNTKYLQLLLLSLLVWNSLCS